MVIMNHHYELDWLYGWMVADRSSILGNGRVYVKKAIQYVPIIGWAWCFSDTLFLARDWSHDKNVLDKVLVDLQARKYIKERANQTLTKPNCNLFNI